MLFRSIVPRTMGALGYVMQVPEEEKYLNTKKEIDAMLVGYLAGRAAEGVTRIGDIPHIQRGYEDPVRDLGLLGARITLEEE